MEKAHNTHNGNIPHTRMTWDEIGCEVCTDLHQNRLTAIYEDQDDSTWLVRNMRDEGVFTITHYVSDRGHLAISVIGPTKSGIAQKLANEIMEWDGE